jgi:ketosteroid isomerase-like protein
VDPLALATRYFEAWGRRDPDAIAAVFAADGTFRDPDGERSAATVGHHARRLFERFPDLTFELHGASPLGDGSVVGRWQMRVGVGDRLVRGADFLTVADDRVGAVERYFDREALATPDAGVAVGTCLRVGSERRSRPGAFGITWQEAPAESDRDVVRRISDRIVRELPSIPGFIGGIAATVGDRFLTVTAWEDPDDPFELIRSGSHRMAAVQFFGSDLYSAGWTGVWNPTRLNARWVRCPACHQMANDARRPCACGAPLPDPPPYW